MSVVLKFGGSSLDSSEKIADVVRIVREEARTADGAGSAVVVSAMGETTAELREAGRLAACGDLDLALRIASGLRARARDLIWGATRVLELSERPHRDRDLLGSDLDQLLRGVSLVHELSPPTLDELLSFGERLASHHLAWLLTASGVPSRAVDARSWLLTDDTHGRATPVESLIDEAIREAPWRDRWSVHTGFIGRDAESQRTTTLGRNGSDYTATLLARALRAREVVIWTDVPGVLTADPRLVPDASPVAHLSYAEALELANAGLGILHPKTLAPLFSAGIPLFVRSTSRPEAPGTRIDAEGSADDTRAACVASCEGLALVDFDADPTYDKGIATPRVLSALRQEGITVWLEVQSARASGEALVVDEAEVMRVEKVLRAELAHELGTGALRAIRVRAGVSLVTLVAERLGRSPNVAGRFFSALGTVGIQVRASAQGASSRAIACVVDGRDTADAVRALHAAFHLASERVSVLLLGKGTVGGQLLELVRAEAENLVAEAGIDLRLVGLVDSRASTYAREGLDLAAVRRQLAAQGGREAIETLLERLERLPVPVLVDCTAESGMEHTYVKALERGIHVVTANKQPFASDPATWARLKTTARGAHRALRYETTVGASLPVIETLKNLVRTGDKVRRVEGSLSGTLGYLCNELARGIPLSKAVATARDLGFTEPHPGDDLSGLDAARKALILARELGMQATLESVDVKPLVPHDLLAERDLGRFFDRLQSHDAGVAAELAELRARGLVRRHLAQIDPGAGTIRVGPVDVELDHPATRLRGSEAFVAFTTSRYGERPLVVQGAGAGGAVTAAGVLADVLSIAQALRGR